MVSFRNSNIIHNIITTISILSMLILLNSCECDSVNKSLPKPATAKALNITQTEATLTGMVYLEGNSTTAYYEYGLSNSHGNTTKSNSHSDGYWGSWPVSIRVTGLSPGTTYHFQLVAKNKYGTAYGSDQSFTTLN